MNPEIRVENNANHNQVTKIVFIKRLQTIGEYKIKTKHWMIYKLKQKINLIGKGKSYFPFCSFRSLEDTKKCLDREFEGNYWILISAIFFKKIIQLRTLFFPSFDLEIGFKTELNYRTKN
ncbi:hypothetical protein BpHYR1_023937 [Brachionus plicatilis]|uniref:Uncharacterized protein n=1 Tax=Brachionus plicatilis TaxID=10195 RepID=A0A3M7R1Y9_BRAPC|nr:hypothetical protein BpHYR1_023937 [Brachionus plicatilis]